MSICLETCPIKVFPLSFSAVDKGRSPPSLELGRSLEDVRVWLSSSDDSVIALKSVRPVVDSFLASASEGSCNLETKEAIAALLSLVKDVCNGVEVYGPISP